MIELYTSPTPNGWKVAMALEELALPNLQRWIESMADKPGIQRGCNVPPAPGHADLVKKGGSKIVTR